MRVVLTVGVDLAEDPYEDMGNIAADGSSTTFTVEDFKALFDGANDITVLEVELID